MEVAPRGSQQNNGHGNLPREDWKQGLESAILKLGEMAQLPNFTELLEDFEPKFKEIVRDSIKKLVELQVRVAFKPLSGGRDQWKERMRKDVKVLDKVLEENITGVYDHLPPGLRSFMDELFGSLSKLEEYASSSVWRIHFHPYLSNASTRIEFMKCTHDFFYNEHPGSRRAVEPIFKKNLEHDWKRQVKGITRKVLEHKPRKVNRNQDSEETYKDAIDSIRLWRNARAHYKKYLPEGERELTDIKIEEMISQDFPGGYEKVYQSVKTILTIKGCLNKRLREKLLNKLLQSITGKKAGGTHGQSCMLVDSTVGARSEQITSVRTRESTAGHKASM